MSVPLNRSSKSLRDYIMRNMTGRKRQESFQRHRDMVRHYAEDSREHRLNTEDVRIAGCPGALSNGEGLRTKEPSAKPTALSQSIEPKFSHLSLRRRTISSYAMRPAVRRPSKNSWGAPVLNKRDSTLPSLSTTPPPTAADSVSSAPLFSQVLSVGGGQRGDGVRGGGGEFQEGLKREGGKRSPSLCWAFSPS